jgi:hypothetical protein
MEGVNLLNALSALATATSAFDANDCVACVIARSGALNLSIAVNMVGTVSAAIVYLSFGFKDALTSFTSLCQYSNP